MFLLLMCALHAVCLPSACRYIVLICCHAYCHSLCQCNLGVDLIPVTSLLGYLTCVCGTLNVIILWLSVFAAATVEVLSVVVTVDVAVGVGYCNVLV